MLLLDLMGKDSDFYVRYYAVQLLTALAAGNTHRLAEVRDPPLQYLGNCKVQATSAATLISSDVRKLGSRFQMVPTALEVKAVFHGKGNTEPGRRWEY